jgi:hypothetical protein
MRNGKRAWTLPGLALAGLLGALLATGCSSTRKAGTAEPADRLETLTNFTIALSKRDFASAAGMLAPGERLRLVGESGAIKEDYRERLRAMRLSTLMNNPMIRVDQGLILGIHDVLPVVDQAPTTDDYALVFDDSAAPAAMEAPVETPAPVQADPEAEEREALRKAARAFFKSVEAKDWKRAFALLDEKEREVFMRVDGKIKPGAKRRLAAIDTSSWQAMTLEDGKLSGAVLLIPATAPETATRSN